MTHLYIIQTATLLSPELGKVIKGPFSDLRKSEKITKILEQPLQ